MTTIRIAHKQVPESTIPPGVLIVGGTGSGKTSLVKAMIVNLLTLGRRLIILDLSNEMEEFVRSRAPLNYPVRVIGGHYHGDARLALAKMFRSETDFLRFSYKLFPDVKGDPQPFFVNSAREICVAAIKTLHHFAPGEWGLHDLVRLVKNRKLFTALARQVGHIGDVYVTLGDEDTRQNVHGTACAKLLRFSVVAALWGKSTEEVNLDNYEGAIILRWQDRDAIALESLFAYAFEYRSEVVLSDQADASAPTEWFFLDEFRQLAPLDCISTIARRGRKSKLAMCATLHEFSGLVDRYGRERAEEICALFPFKVVTRVGGPSTAKWMAEYLGQPEVEESAFDSSKGEYRKAIRDRWNVHPDELRRVPMPDAAKDRISGYVDFPDVTEPFTCPFLADVRVRARGNEQGQRLNAGGAKRGRRPASDEVLHPFTVADGLRLNWPVTLKEIEACLK